MFVVEMVKNECNGKNVFGMNIKCQYLICGKQYINQNNRYTKRIDQKIMKCVSEK